MKKIALALLLCIGYSCTIRNWNQEKISQSGKQITSNRSTASYDKIAVSGSFNVELVAGKEGNITITGDENIISHIVTEVKNDQLYLYLEGTKDYYYDSKITIKVPFESISEVQCTGSGDVITKNTITAENFIARLSGSGDINLDLQAKNTTTSVAGSGDIVLSGTSSMLTASVAGSGDVDCSKLIAENASVDVAGSGDVKVNCTKKLSAEVAGSGNIRYKNKPLTIEKSIAGSGDVEGY